MFGSRGGVGHCFIPCYFCGVVVTSFCRRHKVTMKNGARLSIPWRQMWCRGPLRAAGQLHVRTDAPSLPHSMGLRGVWPVSQDQPRCLPGHRPSSLWVSAQRTAGRSSAAERPPWSAPSDGSRGLRTSPCLPAPHPTRTSVMCCLDTRVTCTWAGPCSVLCAFCHCDFRSSNRESQRSRGCDSFQTCYPEGSPV